MQVCSGLYCAALLYSEDSANRRRRLAEERLGNNEDEASGMLLFEVQSDNTLHISLKTVSSSCNAVEALSSRTARFYILYSCPHAGPSKLSLPPPLAVIIGTKAPEFLRPEATKQLAKPFHRSRAPLTKTVEAKAVAAWDIASMAPKLKGEGDKCGPSGAVISAAAKRWGLTG